MCILYFNEADTLKSSRKTGEKIQQQQQLISLFLFANGKLKAIFLMDHAAPAFPDPEYHVDLSSPNARSKNVTPVNKSYFGGGSVSYYFGLLEMMKGL